MKLKLIITSIFIFTYGIFFYVNTQTKNQRIEFDLNKQIKDLNTHYNLTMDYFLQDVKSIRNNISNKKKAIELFSQALNASEKERNILRDKLYKMLKPMYSRINSRGILQWQFIFPNNKSFLRMHKPSRFGDDLTDVRYSFKIANKTKQTIIGFEKGKTAHAFRYVFPFYNKKGIHLGAIEISLSSNALQEKLLTIDKIHSHFIVKKNIFSTKEWEVNDKRGKYIQSIEHKDYMFSVTQHTSLNKLKNAKEEIILKIKDKIDAGILLKKQFAVYTKYKDTMRVITFVPVKNIKDKEIVAYVISYTNSENIYNICKDYKRSNVIIFLGLLFLFYFIYKNLKQKYDLEEQKKELEQKNKNFEYILDTTMEGIVITDENNKIIQYNQVAVDLFGGENKLSFIGRNLIDFVPDCERPKIQEALLTKYSAPRDYDLKKEDGTIFPTLTSGRDIIRNNQKVRISIILDLTKIKEQEKLIITQSKSAAMGEMMDAIAHQWKQPLGAIGISIQSLEMKTVFGTKVSNKEIIETSEFTQKQISHLVSTIDEFRQFFRPNQKQKIISVNKMINSTLALMKDELMTNNIEYEILGDDNLEISCMPNEFKHIFINLINNSKDAFNQHDIKNRKITFETLKNDEKVIIKISDNAGGIPKDIIDNIFISNFTTKEKGKGTGIGLYLTKQIVEKLHATIVANNIDSGVCFSITI